MFDWYDNLLIDTGRSAALWLLVGFLVTYSITRWVTVRIRRRSLSGEPAGDGPIKDIHIGGVHVHHQVWGILLVLVVGLLTFRYSPDSPYLEVLAALFGVGAALALDEFALWLHLEDVYWSEEGKKSIDAVMIAAVFGLVLLTGSSPVGLQESEETRTWWAAVVLLLPHLTMCVICMLKGKLILGLAGLPLPTVSLIGAIRLAQPESFWAKRFYGDKKMARAQVRYDRYEDRRSRLRDRLFGG